jgi:hypothetical protein
MFARFRGFLLIFLNNTVEGNFLQKALFDPSNKEFMQQNPTAMVTIQSEIMCNYNYNLHYKKNYRRLF